MAYTPLTNTPTWIKITKDYTDFAVAALTNDIEIYTLPAQGVIHAVQVYAPTKFAGGLIATYTISVGIVGNLVKYQAAANVFTAAGVPAITTTTGVESMTSPTSIRASSISTVGNLNAATDGEVEIYLLVSQL